MPNFGFITNKLRNFQSFVLITLIFLSSILANAEQSNNEPEQFSAAELEQLLAPIALYPDTVLSHILIASTYPIEIIQAERWHANHSNLQGSAAVQAVDEKNWDPSVKALVAFPQILKRLSDNLEWTQRLGDAFLQNEELLLSSVQSLRQRAYQSGNLDKMDKLSVSRNQQTIVIEPIQKEVVYVPYYDTRVVYGSWRWSHYPPVHWSAPSYVTHHTSHWYNPYTPFYWAPSVHISYGFFFSSFQWHDRHLVRISRHHYQPHHYYNRQQIVNHRNVTRWAHNPTHRRGVSYRNVSISNRYKSNRPSQVTINKHRSTQKNSVFHGKNRPTKKSYNNKFNASANIASQNRIKKELKDGRISIKDRNSRPAHIKAYNSKSKKSNRANQFKTKKFNQNKIVRKQKTVIKSSSAINNHKSRPTKKYKKHPSSKSNDTNRGKYNKPRSNTKPRIKQNNRYKKQKHHSIRQKQR